MVPGVGGVDGDFSHTLVTDRAACNFSDSYKHHSLISKRSVNEVLPFDYVKIRSDDLEVTLKVQIFIWKLFCFVYKQKINGGRRVKLVLYF